MTSDLGAFLSWYLAISAVGLLALPLAFRLFSFLPDRGYAFARPLGLLLTGYLFWLLGSLGLVRNDPGGILLGALLVGGLGLAWLGREGWPQLKTWLSGNRRTLLAVEIFFLAAFALWAWVRAHNPQIEGTEKPMEFMFINSVLRSDIFPPHDAWLAGHAISYYYFGYLMVGMLARLTGVDPAVAFNLALALLFALAAVGALGVVMNLVALARRRLAIRRAEADPALLASFWPALLAPAFLLLVGNYYGPLEVAHNNGWFRQTQVPAVWYSYGGSVIPADPGPPGLRAGSLNLWEWLDLKRLNVPPAPSEGPLRLEQYNWFFAARAVHDRDLLGNEVEAITEFPAFSFLLGDLHPHVLGLPFVLLAAGLALEWLLWGRARFGSARTRDVHLWPGWPRFLLTAVILGGLAFLNTWDFPIYLFLTLLALTLGLAAARGWRFVPAYLPFLAIGAVALGFASLALYLPFFLTMQSQAGGILPNLIFPTRFQQTVVMFGPLMAGVTLFLGWTWLRSRPIFESRAAWRTGLGILAALIATAAFITLAAWFVLDSPLMFIHPLSLPEALNLFWQRRLVDSAASLYPALLIGVAAGIGVGALLRVRRQETKTAAPVSAPVRVWESQTVSGAGGEADAGTYDPSEDDRDLQPDGFSTHTTHNPGRTVSESGAQVYPTSGPGGHAIAGGNENDDREEIAGDGEEAAIAEIVSPPVLMTLALILTGALLLLAPEFVYLRDYFGSRMNTLFKFYFQVWVLWSLAAAFGIWYIWNGASRALGRRARVGRLLAGLGLLAALPGLVYLPGSLLVKANSFAGPPTLDGMDYFARRYPNDWAAIQWLNANVAGSPVILEGSRGVYWLHGPSSRISMATGLPTLIGWDWHERQWRGEYFDRVAGRIDEINRVYQSRDWDETRLILDRYQVEYVVVSPFERDWHGPVYQVKFERFMEVAFESGPLTIYRYQPPAP
jgi:YYY domain-containing protein